MCHNKPVEIWCVWRRGLDEWLLEAVRQSPRAAYAIVTNLSSTGGSFQVTSSTVKPPKEKP